MLKKQIILLAGFVIFLLIVFVSIYLDTFATKTEIEIDLSAENDFSDFSAQKKKLPQKNEEVSVLEVNNLIMMSGNISKNEEADLDKNSILENYSLENGVLSIVQVGEILWQSNSDWWVDDFVLADVNHDGIVDINMSVWKPGNFGSSQPFWIEENDMSIKNHFFVLDLVNNKIKPVWQSSNLSAPNCAFQILDVDNDSKNDLVVLEGDYVDSPDCLGKYSAVWKWNGWGFGNEWRSGNIEE